MTSWGPRHRRSEGGAHVESGRHRRRATRAGASERCGVEGHWNFGRAQRHCRRWMATRSGRHLRIWSKVWDALVTAGATPVGSDALELYRIVARCAALRHRSARARFAAGDRAAACTELHQRLLCRPGDRRAHSLARERASHFRRLRSCRASRRLPVAKFVADEKEVGEITSAAQFRFRRASARWRWDIFGASSASPEQRCRSGSRMPPCVRTICLERNRLASSLTPITDNLTLTAKC